MNQPNLFNPSPAKSLMVLRIIWAALLMGQLMFLVVLVTVILPSQQAVHPQPMFLWINLGMLLTIVPVTFLIRGMTFRRAEIDGAIPASAYAVGNIIFWAGCEGVSFFGLVAAMTNGSLWPTIVISAIAMGLQVVTFPVGGMLYVPPTE